MKKYLTLLLLSLLHLSLFSQVNFEKGYIVNKNNQKIDCLVKNTDKNNTPQSFIYKLSENSKLEKGDIENVLEFGIGENIKFIRKEVLIDRSRDNFNDMSTQQRAIFDSDTLFLEVLIEGEASLYAYQDRVLNRFFYEIGEKEIEQLVYKKYVVNLNKVGTNNRFRQQLKTKLICDGLKSTDNLGYNKKQLVIYFEKYNRCINAEYKSYIVKKEKKKRINIWAKVEAMSGDLEYRVVGSNPERKTNFGNKKYMQYGLAIEYVFPFNKNKWSLLLEPTLQKFSAEKDNVSFEHKSIEVPLGLRYHIFLTQHAKLYLNTHFMMNWSSETTVDFEVADDLFSDTVNGNFSFGAGFIYRRLGAEVRYKLAKNMLADYRDSQTAYKGVSAILTLRLF